jgi:hypothetical protein
VKLVYTTSKVQQYKLFMHVKIKLISSHDSHIAPIWSISRTDGDIASGMDNECVMNLYDNELDGMKFWITWT